MFENKELKKISGPTWNDMLCYVMLCYVTCLTTQVEKKL